MALSATYNLGGGSLSAAFETLGQAGTGTVNQSGGTNSANLLYLGWSSSASGTYNLSDGVLLSGGTETIGYAGAGTFTQTGGTNTAGLLTVGKFASGTYNLNGGLLIASSLSRGQISAVLNFSGGTLQAGGSFSSNLSMTFGGDGAIFSTAGNNVTLFGSLSGPGSLTENGSGTLILAGTNTFSGKTLIGGGTLALASPLALQDSTLDTSGGGALSFGTLTTATLGGLTGPRTLSIINSSSGAVALGVGNNSTSTSYAGALTGPGSLTKVGSGTLLLTGNNNYSGTTAINQGELQVNGSLASAVTVNSGGTLGGTGSLSSVTVNAGGHLAPGDAPGQLTLSGSLTLLSGAVMDYELDTPLDSDEVYMPNGLLSLNGQQFSDFNFTPLAGFAPGSYTLIDAGSISGGLGANTSGTIDGLPANLAMQGNNLVLNVVPEPGTLALLAFGVLACSAFARRQMMQAAESNGGTDGFASAQYAPVTDVSAELHTLLGRNNRGAHAFIGGGVDIARPADHARIHVSAVCWQRDPHGVPDYRGWTSPGEPK